MEVVEPYRTQSQQSESVGSPASLEPAVQNFIASIPSTEGQQTEPAGSQAAQQSQQTAPRRHRRRRQITETQEDQSLRSATETLASLENVSAQARNRLAAAIEALGARLNEPLRIILEDPHPLQMVQQRRKIIRIIDSDSE